MRIRTTALDKYWTHKACAKRRGVVFKLTFEEWLNIWEVSGRFSQRGRRAHEYHMARHGDAGPYAVGNVKIITSSQNIAGRKSRKGWKCPPFSEEHRRRLSEAHTGKKASAKTRKKLSAMRKGVKMNLSAAERLRRSVAITKLNSLASHRAKQVAGRWP
jgi:hypothetical protein